MSRERTNVLPIGCFWEVCFQEVSAFDPARVNEERTARDVEKDDKRVSDRVERASMIRPVGFLEVLRVQRAQQVRREHDVGRRLLRAVSKRRRRRKLKGNDFHLLHHDSLKVRPKSLPSRCVPCGTGQASPGSDQTSGTYPRPRGLFRSGELVPRDPPRPGTSFPKAKLYVSCMGKEQCPTSSAPTDDKVKKATTVSSGLGSVVLQCEISKLNARTRPLPLILGIGGGADTHFISKHTCIV